MGNEAREKLRKKTTGRTQPVKNVWGEMNRRGGCGHILEQGRCKTVC